ncbi:hypothetical protein, partial [Shewanella algae]
WVFVGSVALIFVLLRYVSIQLASTTTAGKNKEVSMVETFMARTRILFSSVFETTWAAGVSYAAGRLST